MIELSEVSKKYKTPHFEIDALKAVSININSGDYVALRGESGSGKTTLLNIIGMIDKADAGEYHYAGDDLLKMSENSLNKFRKNKVGFIFQSFQLIHNLNVFENIEMPLLYSNLSHPERKEKVKYMINHFGIDTHAKHYPAQLSGGQQQRVAIARAVINNPELIIADEPTGNLDEDNSDIVMNLLQELNAEGKTIVMATHSDYCAAFAKTNVYIKNGEIVG